MFPSKMTGSFSLRKYFLKTLNDFPVFALHIGGYMVFHSQYWEDKYFLPALLIALDFNFLIPQPKAVSPINICSKESFLTTRNLLVTILHNKKLTSYYPAQFAWNKKTILGALLGTHCTANQSLFNSGTLSAGKYPSLFAWATSCFCFQGSFWNDKAIGQQAGAFHDRQAVPGKNI